MSMSLQEWRLTNESNDYYGIGNSWGDLSTNKYEHRHDKTKPIRYFVNDKPVTKEEYEASFAQVDKMRAESNQNSRRRTWMFLAIYGVCTLVGFAGNTLSKTLSVVNMAILGLSMYTLSNDKTGGGGMLFAFFVLPFSLILTVLTAGSVVYSKYSNND